MYAPNTYLLVVQVWSSKLFTLFEALSWHPTEISNFFLALKKSTIFHYIAPSAAPQQARSSWVQSWGCLDNIRSNLNLQPSSVKAHVPQEKPVICRINDAKHASYFDRSELDQVHPACGLHMTVLSPLVEWILMGLWLSSSPGAQGKCQYLHLGKGNLARETALQNPKALLAPR